MKKLRKIMSRRIFEYWSNDKGLLSHRWIPAGGLAGWPVRGDSASWELKCKNCSAHITKGSIKRTIHFWPINGYYNGKRIDLELNIIKGGPETNIIPSCESIIMKQALE